MKTYCDLEKKKSLLKRGFSEKKMAAWLSYMGK